MKKKIFKNCCFHGKKTKNIFHSISDTRLNIYDLDKPYICHTCLSKLGLETKKPEEIQKIIEEEKLKKLNSNKNNVSLDFDINEKIDYETGKKKIKKIKKKKNFFYKIKILMKIKKKEERRGKKEITV
jgi:hypothetical protein